MPVKYGLVEDYGGNVIKAVKPSLSDLDQKRQTAIAARQQARENKERERRSAARGGGGESSAAQKKAMLDAKHETDMQKKQGERTEKIKVAEEKTRKQQAAEALKPKLSSAKYA